MPQAAPIIAAVVSVAGLALSYKSSSEAAAAQEDAARQAQRIAEMNALNAERENAQKEKNLSSEQARQEAANRARASSSGVEVRSGGSFGLSLAGQEETNAEELEWLKRAGASNVDIIKAGGQAAYDTGMASASATTASGWGTLVSGAGQLYGIGNSAGWYG